MDHLNKIGYIQYINNKTLSVAYYSWKTFKYLKAASLKVLIKKGYISPFTLIYKIFIISFPATGFSLQSYSKEKVVNFMDVANKLCSKITSVNQKRFIIVFSTLYVFLLLNPLVPVADQEKASAKILDTPSAS